MWTDTFRKSSTEILSFLSFLRKTCVASITQPFLVPVSKVFARNAWHNDPRKRQNSQGGTSRKIGTGCAARFLKTLILFETKICDFPYPISDLIKYLIPNFRPEAEPGASPERVTCCYGTYTVVGVNIKLEMVLSPDDEEVANSSKKHTQFKTRVHKPYPISDQNG